MVFCLKSVSRLSFYHQRVLEFQETPNFKIIFKELPELKEKNILSCGNCPSFYFPENKIQCLRGWNFSMKPDRNPELVPEAFILFKENEWFCRKQVPKGWIRHSFSEVEVFLKP